MNFGEQDVLIVFILLVGCLHCGELVCILVVGVPLMFFLVPLLIRVKLYKMEDLSL